jgi:tetrahydromethanopterin S-methyltransferase subunit G
MKSTMTNSQKTADLKRLAYQCVEQKYNGCNNNCGNCPLNVSLYTDDPREAVLIRTNAELDYQKDVQYQNEQIQRQIDYQKQENAKSISSLVGVLIGIFLTIILPILMIQSCIQSCS